MTTWDGSFVPEPHDLETDRPDPALWDAIKRSPLQWLSLLVALIFVGLTLANYWSGRFTTAALDCAVIVMNCFTCWVGVGNKFRTLRHGRRRSTNQLRLWMWLWVWEVTHAAARPLAKKVHIIRGSSEDIAMRNLIILDRAIPHRRDRKTDTVIFSEDDEIWYKLKYY